MLTKAQREAVKAQCRAKGLAAKATRLWLDRAAKAARALRASGRDDCWTVLQSLEGSCGDRLSRVARHQGSGPMHYSGASRNGDHVPTGFGDHFGPECAIREADMDGACRADEGAQGTSGPAVRARGRGTPAPPPLVLHPPGSAHWGEVKGREWRAGGAGSGGAPGERAGTVLNLMASSAWSLEADQAAVSMLLTSTATKDAYERLAGEESGESGMQGASGRCGGG